MSTYPQNYALVIGNNAYKNFDQLENPHNDAKDLAATLRSINFEVFEHYDVDKASMEDILLDFSHHLGKNTLALFYFTGYIMQIQQQNYLTPIDAYYKSETIMKNGCLSSQMVIDALARTGSPVGSSRIMRHGLTNLSEGLLVAYATSADKVTYEQSGHDNLYMKHLKANIVQADVGIENILQRTHDAVAREAKDHSTRQLLTPYGDFSDYIYFQPKLTTPEQTQQVKQVSIQSIPHGAQVEIDDEYVGTTPLQQITIPQEVQRVTLRLAGYETHYAALEELSVDTEIELKVNTASEFLRRVEQGGMIQLAATKLHLEDALTLQNDITLLGEGYEQTQIVSSAAKYVVHYTGGGTFTAQGIGFEHTGDAIADVVHVDNGTLDIDSCQFTQWKDGGNANGGVGLCIKGSTRGTVRNSLFNDNGSHGIQVSENAQPKLEQNRLHNNTKSGIAYFDSAAGTAVSNESHNNGLSGIIVKGNAQPRIEQNRLHDNTQSGISYVGSSGGSALSNKSYNNGLSGIVVQGNAQPRLKQNRLHDNTQDGISYSSSSGGSAVGNDSHSNGLSGIAVRVNAKPRLEQNRLHDNTQSGISYAGSARGSAVNNESYNNSHHGISLKDNAQPRLEQNRLYDNTQDGISYFHQSGGNAQGNESYANGCDGIGIGGKASPNIKGNILYQNRYGLYTEPASQPTIGENSTYHNHQGDVENLH